MKNTALEMMDADVHLLRAQVEKGVTGPAVIVVTSAQGGDGKSLTAFALAESLARSGRRTALLDATKDSPKAIDDRLMLAGGTERDVPVSLSLPDDDRGLSRAEISAFFEATRASYDFLIIDTAPLLTSHKAMALSALADGTLLSVRVGRAATAIDQKTVQLIEETNDNILGVVAVSSKAIAEFERQRAGVTALTTSASAPPRPSHSTVTVDRWFVPRLVGTLVLLAALSVSIMGAAIYNKDGYRALGMAPEPARSFVARVLSQLKHSPN